MAGSLLASRPWRGEVETGSRIHDAYIAERDEERRDGSIDHDDHPQAAHGQPDQVRPLRRGRKRLMIAMTTHAPRMARQIGQLSQGPCVLWEIGQRRDSPTSKGSGPS